MDISSRASQSSGDRPPSAAAYPDPRLADHGFLLSALLDHIPSSIYFKDLRSRFILINRAQARTLNLGAPEEAIGKSDCDFFAEQHANDAFRDEQQIVQSGQPLLDKEEMETWPDGRVTWVSTSKMPLLSPEGEIIGTFGISRDVTKSRHTRQALMESEARFQELITAIHEVFWILEAGTGRALYVSSVYEAIWGRPVPSLYRDPLGWISYVHEDDRENLAALYTEEHRVPFEVSFRIRRPDGELRWIRHRGFPVFDEEKRVVRVAGVSADITKARQANDEFVRTQRLLASIVNSSHDAISASRSMGPSPRGTQRRSRYSGIPPTKLWAYPPLSCSVENRNGSTIGSASALTKDCRYRTWTQSVATKMVVLYPCR